MSKGPFVRNSYRLKLAAGVLLAGAAVAMSQAAGFEGRIRATVSQDGRVTPMLYTFGTNCLRLEISDTNRINPVDIWNLQSGALILLYPNNRSFIRLKDAVQSRSPVPPGFSVSPTPGPAVKSTPPTAPAGLPPMPAMPNGPRPPGMPGGALPALPPFPPENLQLRSTGQTTNLLGYPCTGYEIKQRRQTMEIWATARLPGFEPYLQNQPHRFGPPRLQDQWGEMLKTKKLFPLLAVLRFDNGAERFRFEVQSVTRENLGPAAAGLFEPPTNYVEIPPLPF